MTSIPSRLLLLGVAVCALAGVRANAQDRENDEPLWGQVQLAPFAGLQLGGSVFTPAGSKASLDAGLDYGGTLDIQVAETWRVELMYSRQEIELPGVDATVERYLAGVVEEQGDGPTRFFGVALIGPTRFVPGRSGFGSTTLFTVGLGLGVKHLFTDHFGVRAEGRGFFVITNSVSGLFCSGGCLFTFSGDGFVQGDFTAGLVLDF